MSQTTETADIQINELVADFVIKRISKKEKKHSSKHKHKKKKSKSKHKYKDYSSSNYDSSSVEERSHSKSSSLDSGRNKKKYSSKHKSSKHRRRSRSSSLEYKSSKHRSSSSEHKSSKHRMSSSSEHKSSKRRSRSSSAEYRSSKRRSRNSSFDESEKYSRKKIYYKRSIDDGAQAKNKEMENEDILESDTVKKFPKSALHDDDNITFGERTIMNVELNSLPNKIPELDSSSKFLETCNVDALSSNTVTQNSTLKDENKSNSLFNVNVNELVKTVVNDVIIDKGEKDISKQERVESNDPVTSGLKTPVCGITDSSKNVSLDTEQAHISSAEDKKIEPSDSDVKSDIKNEKSDNEKLRKNHNEKRRYRSRSRESDRTYEKHKRYNRSRSRSRDRGRYRYKTDEKDYYQGRSNENKSSYSKSHDHRDFKRSKDRDDESDNYKSHRSTSKERKEQKKKTDKEKFDKAKLLQVARKNVLSMIEQGTLPQGIEIDALKKEQLLTLKAGGHSVKELTDFCRTLSEKEKSSVNIDNTSDYHHRNDDHDDSEQPFIHHPFKLKEPSTIKLNIRNSVPLPIKTHAEKVTENARTLSFQFPVSSGDQHRQKELEWIPVEKKSSTKTSHSATKPPSKPTVATSAPLPPPPLPPSLPSMTPALQPPPIPPPLPPPPPPPSLAGTSSGTFSSTGASPPVSSFQPPPTIELTTPVYADSVGYFGFQMNPFTVKPKKSINLHAIVAKRFKAIQKLNQDPNDMSAIRDMQEAQLEMQAWVESQHIPGQFTGSTHAKVLSVDELCGPRPVWAKKDIFTKAAPVTDGKGMALLRKMGWNPGEGLGKNKEGTLEPLFLDVKMDKRGLVTLADKKKLIIPFSTDLATEKQKNALQGKHPVSALMEYCSKKKWPPPMYTEVDIEPENAPKATPAQKRSYLFKVQINSIEYQPATPQCVKKTAKADAALVALRHLGIIPNE